MDVVVMKILSLIVLTTSTLLSGLLPMRLMKCMSHSVLKHHDFIQYILSGLRCFCGGVFLATVFLHLIPETRLIINNVTKQMGSNPKYPLAELLTMAGFYAVLFTEQLIMLLYRKHTTERDDGLTQKTEVKCSNMELTRNRGSVPGGTSLNSLENQDQEANLTNLLDESDIEVKESHEPAIELDESPPDLELKNVVTVLSRGDDSRRHHIRSVIFIIALSFHGVFEGMALGLQTTESNVWTVCFSIIVHKCVRSFGHGLQMTKSNEKQSMIFLCIGASAVISAVGIVIGIVISSGAMLYSDANVPHAILQSLATGTILYIVFFDILYKDMGVEGDIRRTSCTFVGFAFMAVLFAILMP